MTPSSYAADELAGWERALREQRQAEARLATARRRRHQPKLVLEAALQVIALRTRADLLLAQAVKVMCTFRQGRVFEEGLSGTQLHSLLEHGRGDNVPGAGCYD